MSSLEGLYVFLAGILNSVDVSNELIFERILQHISEEQDMANVLSESWTGPDQMDDSMVHTYDLQEKRPLHARGSFNTTLEARVVLKPDSKAPDRGADHGDQYSPEANAPQLSSEEEISRHCRMPTQTLQQRSLQDHGIRHNPQMCAQRLSPGAEVAEYSCMSMQIQADAQLMLQRSLQASQQMLLDGIAVSIGMIEELETLQHENDGRMRKSSYPTMGYSPLPARNVPEALSRIEASLATTKGQFMFAPCQAVEEAKPIIMKAILRWLGTRATHIPKTTSVDHYAVNVLELLMLGDMKMNSQMADRRKQQSSPLDEKTIMNTLKWIGRGRVFSEQQDEEYKQKPEKGAMLSSLRNEGNVHVGAMRACRVNPELGRIFERCAINTESMR